MVENAVSLSKKAEVRAIILDMDGVLWRENEAIGDLAWIFDRIGKLNWQVSLATNNASKSTAQYLEKLRQFGVTLKAEQIITSGEATANYLHQQYPGGGNVYIVGENGLVETLASHGFSNCDKDVLAVVASFDRLLTYDKLKRATLLIRAGAPLIATNADLTFPSPEGQMPGAGAILAAIVAAAQVKPTIIGKPEPEMYRLAIGRMEVPEEATLVVGDRLETDIAGGQKIGCQTALVLSGVSSRPAAEQWQPAPDWITEDLAALIRHFL
jgi:4-nitrophenyl phosphatase